MLKYFKDLKIVNESILRPEICLRIYISKNLLLVESITAF
jgi:hypothetical protein